MLQIVVPAANPPKLNIPAGSNSGIQKILLHTCQHGMRSPGLPRLPHWFPSIPLLKKSSMKDDTIVQKNILHEHSRDVELGQCTKDESHFTSKRGRGTNGSCLLRLQKGGPRQGHQNCDLAGSRSEEESGWGTARERVEGWK